MILQKLFELAQHVKPVGHARVVAAVVQKGKIVCVASNEKKSDPSQKRTNKWLCKCGHEKTFHKNTEWGCHILVDEGNRLCKCTIFVSIEEEKIHWHAETKVIKRAKKLVSGTHPGYLDGCVLYVARAKKLQFTLGNHLFFESKSRWVEGLARPCEGCWKAIHAAGITKVVWTTGEEDVFGKGETP